MKYSDAGVDIRQGDELVKRIRGFAEATFKGSGRRSQPGRVLSGLGGFGALYQLGEDRQPVLV